MRRSGHICLSPHGIDRSGLRKYQVVKANVCSSSQIKCCWHKNRLNHIYLLPCSLKFRFIPEISIRLYNELRCLNIQIYKNIQTKETEVE